MMGEEDILDRMKECGDSSDDAVCDADIGLQLLRLCVKCCDKVTSA